jgi:hypothetical protein
MKGRETRTVQDCAERLPFPSVSIAFDEKVSQRAMLDGVENFDYTVQMRMVNVKTSERIAFADIKQKRGVFGFSGHKLLLAHERMAVIYLPLQARVTSEEAQQ